MKRYSQSSREGRQRATGWWFRGIALGAMIVAAGCSTTGALTKDTPSDVKSAAVKERSNARWAALIKGDKDAAYAYLSPGTRSLITIEQYRGRVQTGGFRAVQIEKVDCEPETCNVGLMLTYDYVAPKGVGSAKGITTYVQETWVLENGQAWFVMRP
ncbi:MAG: hypothetical protein ABI724_07125 [Betaproteobacteria bacterium]